MTYAVLQRQCTCGGLRGPGWAMAVSFIHELMHVCGQADHDTGDQAKETCGRLPDIIRISPRIEISNPL